MRTTLTLLVLLGSGCTCTTLVNPDGGEGGGTATGGGGGGGGGGSATGGGTTSGCGLYQSLCSGSCVPTGSDPANCGGCGLACQPGQVCTGSACRQGSECPASLTACNGRCVDLNSNNEYCGACTATAACPADKGCSGGTCVTKVVLDGGGPSNCAAGGPPVLVGPTDGPATCAGTLAQVTFRWGLCSCSGISASSAITIDAFSSSLPDGGLGGSLGANGTYSAAREFRVTGAMWLEDSLSAAAAGQVGDLNVGGTCTGANTQVTHDARVTGNVSALRVGGQLLVSPGSTVGTDVTAGSLVRGPVVVPPPCDCKPEQRVDILGIIANGKQSNDNASISLSPSVLTALSAPTRLDLPCGRYFLTRINANQPTTIAIHGRTALFIEGDLSAAGDLAFSVDPGAELDVFIGGGVTSSGAIRFGSPERPAQSRFYLHGGISSSTRGVLAGNFYLPTSTFSTSGGAHVYGSVFCGSLGASGSLDVHYDQAIRNAGVLCSGDGGIPLPRDGGVVSDCDTCRDCGNQACVQGTCGACTDDSQCCAPLVCSQGVCVDATGIN